MHLDPHAIYDMTHSGLNRIQQAISIYDAELKLAVSNRRFQEMFGLPDHLAVQGASFAETIRFLAKAGDYGPVAEIEQFVEERVAQALTFEPHYVERTRASGMVISVEGSPVRQGGWVTVYTDITPIKKQEALLRGHSAQLSEQLLGRSEALARSNRELAAANAALENAKRDLTETEARTRVTAEMTPAHIARVDLDRRYTYSNRKLPSILPGASADITGKTIEEALGAEAYGHVAPHLEAAFNGKAAVFEFELDSLDRRLRCAFTPDLNGTEVSGVYILSTDVTEEARARAALSQVRKRELAAQLANGLAHDFSNLLTIIIGLQGQIERQTDVPDTVRELAATTKDAALRGGDLLDRLADIAGSRGLSPCPVVIDELFENLSSLSRAAVPETVTVSFVNENIKDPVELDPGYTQDALLNLLLNASDAMTGSGEIEVVARRTEDRRIQLEVIDQGPGFSAEALERAFDPFFTTKARGEGSGLGLTMVYDYAKLCGGRIHVENRPTGARVLLSIPYKPVADQTTPKLILLVEDTPDIRQSVRAMLRDEGYTVLEADTGEEALALARLPNVDLVLTDIMLGGTMTGLDLAKALTKNGESVPLRMISGLPASDPIRKEAALQYPVLRKPFSPSQLREFLQGSGP